MYRYIHVYACMCISIHICIPIPLYIYIYISTFSLFPNITYFGKVLLVSIWVPHRYPTCILQLRPRPQLRLLVLSDPMISIHVPTHLIKLRFLLGNSERFWGNDNSSMDRKQKLCSCIRVPEEVNRSDVFVWDTWPFVTTVAILVPT